MRRLWKFLIGFKDVNREYRVVSKRLWNRFKPYRDCVKEKLKWRFFTKKGTFYDEGVNVSLAGLLVQRG